MLDFLNWKVLCIVLLFTSYGIFTQGCSSGTCIKGATQSCICTDGRKGAQLCQEDGISWGECTCTGPQNTQDAGHPETSSEKTKDETPKRICTANKACSKSEYCVKLETGGNACFPLPEHRCKSDAECNHSKAEGLYCEDKKCVKTPTKCSNIQGVYELALRQKDSSPICGQLFSFPGTASRGYYEAKCTVVQKDCEVKWDCTPANLFSKNTGKMDAYNSYTGELKDPDKGNFSCTVDFNRKVDSFGTPKLFEWECKSTSGTAIVCKGSSLK